MKKDIISRYEKFMDGTIKGVIDMDVLMNMDPAQAGIIKDGLRLADDIMNEYVALFERTERMEAQLNRIEELIKKTK